MSRNLMATVVVMPMALFFSGAVFGKEMPVDGIERTLFEVSEEERENLPTPSINPIYSSWPEYNRTPEYCVGDDDLGNYLAELPWPSEIVRVDNVGNFRSVVYERGTDTSDMIDLSWGNISYIKTYTASVVQRIKSGQWIDSLLGAGDLGLKLKKLIVSARESPKTQAGGVAGAVLWIVKKVREPIRKAEDRYLDIMPKFVQRMQYGSAYRVQTIINHAGRAYLRVTYGIGTHDKELMAMSSCYYLIRWSGAK